MAQYLGKQRVRIINKYFAPKTIKEAFNERTTANGLLVVNSSSAELKTVEGNTVRTTNEFDISQITTNSVCTTTDRDISVIGYYAKSSGKTLRQLFPYIKAGGTYTFSATVECDTPLKGSACDVTTLNGIRLFGNYDTGYSKKVVTIKKENLDQQVYFYGNFEGSTVTWKNFMCVEGDYSSTDMPEWSPFFTGLKSASFTGIKSTKADGTKESVLSLPKPIECGLGTMIDFENQKIVEKGVTIVLTGEENMRVYLWPGTVGIAFIEILPQYEKRAFGVCEDCIYIGDCSGAEEQIWIGVDNKWMYWTNILNRLGFTSSWVDTANPTDGEKNQAIADFRAYLAQRYADGNPVTIKYLASAVQSETPFTEEQKAVGNKYAVVTGGSETVIGNDENKEFVTPTTEILYPEQIGVKWFETKIKQEE